MIGQDIWLEVTEAYKVLTDPKRRRSHKNGFKQGLEGKWIRPALAETMFSAVLSVLSKICCWFECFPFF